MSRSPSRGSSNGQSKLQPGRTEGEQQWAGTSSSSGWSGSGPEEEMDCAICRTFTLEDREMLRCASCRTLGHPSCLQMSEELAAACRTYACEC